MRALVTGATGFLGRRLVRRLQADGAAVRALVLPGEDASMLAGAEVARGDITDAAQVAMATRDCDRVYHLAAVVGDWGPDELFERVNVGGTRNVLEAAAGARCARVIMASSIVVYGWQLHTRVCDEDLPRERGVGPYGRTKRRSEELACDYHAAGRVPVTVVRPGNVYGEGSGIWVDAIVDILRAGRGLLIDGGDGDAVLAHVDNVVAVIALAGTHPAAPGRIYNATDGAGVTWRQYLGDLATAASLAAPRRSVPWPVALALAAGLERTWRALGRSERPLVTREAVTLLASRYSAPVDRAVRELGYRAPVGYREALGRIARYIQGGAP